MRYKSAKLLLTGFAFLLYISCSGTPGDNKNSTADTTGINEMADSVLNPQTGIAGDINEQSGALSGGQNMQFKAQYSGVIMKGLPSLDTKGRWPVYNGGILNGFTSSSDGDGVYYLRAVSSPMSYSNAYFEDSLDFFTVTNRFYSTPDTNSISIAYSGNIWTNIWNGTVRSIRHIRTLTNYYTNLIVTEDRRRAVFSNWSLTNITVDTGTSNYSAVLTGSRTESITVTNTLRTGSCTISYVFNNLLLTRQGSAGNYYAGIYGDVTFTLNGTWTNYRGTVRAIDETKTISFHSNGTLTINCDGSTSVTNY